jgi:hypothetical protein
MSVAGRWVGVLSGVVVLMIIAWSFGMPSMLRATDGPEQQIILKWRDSLPQNERAAITTRVLREVGARYGISLQYQRELGVGASVYKLSRPLSRKEMADLIGTLTADPNVEYAEEDALMQTMPGS